MSNLGKPDDKNPSKPWLTLRFYPDGTVDTESGEKGTFPNEPEAIVKITGTITLVLWQIAEAGYRRMLAMRVANASVHDYLSQLLNKADGEPN